MNWQHLDINLLKENPDNPRTITDVKFEQLVKSIKDFPEMLEIRPLVADKDYLVLGGNMRLRACKAAGLKQVPVILADSLTETQKREFIIKDNVGFGEWEWEAIIADWPEAPEWGLDIPEFARPDDFGTSFTLPDGDKVPFQQMTFTLADAQAERIKAAMADVEVQPGTEYGNENGNGNKLHQIVLEWAEQRI
jgi:hypothetical protein